MASTWLFPRSASDSGSNRRQTQQQQSQQQAPGLLYRTFTPTLLCVAKRAAIHPIYTMLSVALLASTTYLGLIESSLFDRRISANNAIGRIDSKYLLAGSKKLYTGPETDWKWSTKDLSFKDELALLTLVFPDTAPGSYNPAPQPNSVVIPSNSSAKSLPASSSRLTPISYDSSLAFSMQYSEVYDFIASMQELSVSEDASKERYLDEDGISEKKKWIMKAVRKPGSLGIRKRLYEVWTDFVDLLKNAESLDILIMALGYAAMHLTFVSLFLSMKKMGSNFWLAFTVMVSGLFALLFSLVVTTKLGVPLNMVLLSEGLPFLVVTVGFEKPILLTKAVLAASISRQRRPQNQRGQDSSFTALPSTQEAVAVAVKEHGLTIIRDYLIEILVLVAGTFSGVQGGLRQFCFLAAWILFFDFLLLFTFYIAILTIKLEINLIKRHVSQRRELEADGISRRTAENVANSNDRRNRKEKKQDLSLSTDFKIFGVKVGDRIVFNFKLLMFGGFVIGNILNVMTMGFSSGPSPLTSALTSLVRQPPMDPFRVAGLGLNDILTTAQSRRRSVVVTVFAPLKYELEYPSTHYAPPAPNFSLGSDLLDGMMGGKVVEPFLKSFEDPSFGKWILTALVISLALNGYLFNAARWSIQDPVHHDSPPRNIEVLDQPAQPQVPHAAAPRENKPIPAPIIREPQPPRRESSSQSTRTPEEIDILLKAKRAADLDDEELVSLSLAGRIPGYALEKTLGNFERAVKIRRLVVARTNATRDTSPCLENSLLPYTAYDYERVFGACCENVIGYLPLPIGVAGPLNIDGQNFFLPMATTEGVLIASASRGCKAINAGGGATTVLTGDGMTRGPCVGFKTLARAAEAKVWVDSEEGQRVLTDSFNSTSRFARLQHIKTALAGTYLYIRFKTTTGDAMGMNMISKGVEHALKIMSTEVGFTDMQIISLSGNYCTDKKASAINWVDGRGKSVVAEAIIPPHVVSSVLKADVDSLVELNTSKNLIGSAMAGSIGGFNAHAANIVAAIFLATGQDPAQVVEGSNCITTMRNLDGHLQISVSMPSIEVGTLGGGTILEPQAAMLDLLGVRGSHPSQPGENARQLARIIAAAVLCGELSLCSALAAGHLVQAHMSHNRSTATSRATTPAPSIPTTPTIERERDRLGLAITSTANSTRRVPHANGRA